MKAHFSKVLYETQRKDTFLKVKNEMQRPLSLRMMVLAFAYLLRNESFLHKKLPQPYRSNGYSAPQQCPFFVIVSTFCLNFRICTLLQFALRRKTTKWCIRF